MKRIVCLVVCICLSVGLIAVPISNAASCEENSKKSFWSLISFEKIEELYRAICEKLGFCSEKEEEPDIEGEKKEENEVNKGDKEESEEDREEQKDPDKNETSQDSEKAEETKDSTVREPEEETKKEQEKQSENSASAFEKEVIRLVNAERAKYGLSPLTYSEELTRGAREKSADMQKNNYFSHTSPTYGSPFDQMKQMGITYQSAGENIAMGYSTPEAVVNAWMNSEGHRKNILSANYNEIGVGYVEQGHYWTQWFRG